MTYCEQVYTTDQVKRPEWEMSTECMIGYSCGAFTFTIILLYICPASDWAWKPVHSQQYALSLPDRSRWRV